MDFDTNNDDSLFKDAVRIVLTSRKASASALQRHLRVGYSRAARLIDSMEEQGIVGPADGARPREVLISSMDDLEGGAAQNSEDEFYNEV
jgi:S-DNA-T family DNA segregation ATPase FtsK/SpoIIIE